MSNRILLGYVSRAARFARFIFFKFVNFFDFAEICTTYAIGKEALCKIFSHSHVGNVFVNVCEKAIFILETLDQLFPNPQVPLARGDPSTLLIAVMLSAQCTDLVMNRVSGALFELADNPRSMALLSEEQIAEIIRPCGLSNRKAGAILATSKLLLEKFEGSVPDTFGELESLPRVGHKTASVVMAQAFSKEAFRWIPTLQGYH
jgi:hypothetical protein